MRDPLKPKPARFLLCVNDPANGEPSGRIAGIELCGDGTTRLDLEPCKYPEPRFRWVQRKAEKRIRISGREFPYLGSKSWVGNWCWDAVVMSPSVAADLLNHLRTEGWQATGGEVRYGRLWDSGEPFRPSDTAIITAEILAARKEARAGRDHNREMSS